LRGGVERRELPDGLVETSREVELTLPASSSLGPQRGELSFRWSNGPRKECPVAWTVTPLIRALPPGLVVQQGDKSACRTVKLTCDERPFRIRSVHSSLLAKDVELPAESRREHSLLIDIDPLKGATDKVCNLVITTDDPTQPETLLSVLVLPSNRPGGSP
jgi:hypothetical protein